MMQAVPHRKRQSDSKRVAVAGVALASLLAVGLLATPQARGQQKDTTRAVSLVVEPTVNMEIVVVLRDGQRVEGTLTTINPERIAIKQGDALRDIERSEIARLEYDVVLVMRDGQRLVGRRVEQGRDWITLRIAGVEARVPTENVERVELQPPLRERYERMRSLIDDGDVARLLLVAEWLQNVGMYEEAIVELDHILRVDQFSDKGRQLRELVSRQIEMRERRAQRDAENALEKQERAESRAPEPEVDPSEVAEEDEEIDQGPGVPLGHSRDFPLLSPEQVNLMKVYELDLRSPPKILIDRTTIDKLLQRYSGSPLVPSTRVERDRFYRKNPAEILDLMFQLQARDLYGEVRVIDGVDSMERFRDEIHVTWLLQNCATSACHGGENPSGLTFYRRRPGAEQSVYTNFLILDKYRTDDGEPLINWQTPDRSLLFQMGLNRDNAFRPHPEVKGWRPVFRNSSERRFREGIEWIESMYRPRTESVIEYDPPGEAARGAVAHPGKD
jgi:hypothetical protein